MRKLVLILSAAAAVGFALPVISAQAEEGRVVVRTGEHRDHDRNFHRNHHKVVVIERDHDRGYHRGWHRHHHDDAKVIIKTRHHDRDRG